MSEKYKGKYRVDSSRLRYWDYASSGIYYITICTKKRVPFFGNIKNGRMLLSELGTIANAEWVKTFEIRKDMNLTMGEYVVMPDHFHAIVIIGKNDYNSSSVDELDDNGRDAMHCVSTYKNKFGPQSKNLASIVRGFKSAVTTIARKKGKEVFAWQERFYDRIIKDEEDFYYTSNYIANNPKNWKQG